VSASVFLATVSSLEIFVSADVCWNACWGRLLGHVHASLIVRRLAFVSVGTGNLTVYTQTSLQPRSAPITSVVGDQGNIWKQLQFLVQPGGAYQLLIEASTLYATNYINIAVDDIRVDPPQTCSAAPTTVSPRTVTPPLRKRDDCSTRPSSS